MLLEIWESVSGRAVKPNLHQDREFVVSSDADDEVDKQGSAPPVWDNLSPISGVPCIIAYVNSKGISSERLITCQRVDQHKAGPYLWAYCHTRAAVRQFRISRIETISDASTGETFASVSHFFSRFSIDNIHRSQPGWGLSVNGKNDFVALLNALVFLARCDKKYHPMERASLEDFVTRFWLRMEAPGDPDIDSIVGYADKLAPDAEVFWVSLHRCASNQKLANLLRQSAAEMVDADGIISTEEFYWGAKLDTFLSNF